MYSYIEGLDCVNSAYRNTLLARQLGKSPTVWFCITRKGKHAYLQIDDEILNEGVTWMNDYYPELTLEDIYRMEEEGLAEDITDFLDQAYEQDCEGIEREPVFPLYTSHIQRSLLR